MMHVRRRDDGECIGCIEVGLFEIVRALVRRSPRRGDFGLEMARILPAAVRTGVQGNWRGLRAIEEQIESITEEFEREDVLHARVRANFDAAKATLAELHKQVQTYTGPSDLREPDHELGAMVQRIVDNEVNHVPTR